MSTVVTGEAVVLDVPCARFPSRLLALLLDMAVQIFLGVAVLVIIGAAGGRLNAASVAAVVVTAAVAIIVGYPAAFETLTRGRSLGKMALGLRVVSDDGGPERFRQALVRAMAAVVEIWMLTGAPALICSLLSERGKRLGDLFAGTFVIQERLPRRVSLPPLLAVVPPPLTGWSQALQLSGLNDQTAEQAASYLRRFYELTAAARDELGQRIAAAVAAQVAPPPPPGTPPAAFLSAVLAVRRQREVDRLAAAAAMTAPEAWPATRRLDDVGPAPAPTPAQAPPGPAAPVQAPPAQAPPAQAPPAQAPPAQAPPAQAPPAQAPWPPAPGDHAPPAPPGHPPHAPGGFAPPA
jgi:uncharacterized RDD family membrane protein YckC